MKKIDWIIGLSLTGLLLAFGATYALGNVLTNKNTTTYKITTTSVAPIEDSQQQGQAVYALYTPNITVSNNQQAPNSNTNPNTYGPGSGFGGYGGYRMMDGNSGNYWGCGGYGGSGSTGGSLATKDESSLQADSSASLQNANVDKDKNTITYTGDNVKLVILGGPEQADDKFVIDGLVNPTIQIPKGATVTVEFANADAGMPHAFEVTNAAPPYDYMAMMYGGIYPSSIIGILPEAQNNQYAAAQTTFKADYAGTFYYICQYPGHAAKGMYGKIVIQ